MPRVARHLPHTLHHRHEVKQAKRRFALIIGLMALSLGLALIGELASSSHPGHTVVVSGQVVADGTLAGIPNVRVDLCRNRSAITNAAGVWTQPLAAGSPFCVRLHDTNASKITYEHQVAGRNCRLVLMVLSCNPSARRDDRPSDEGYQLTVSGPVTGGVGAAGVVPSVQLAVAAPAKPTPPGSFRALSAGDNAVVALSWTPSTSPAGIKGYQLERGLDLTHSVVLAGTITTAAYRDDSAGFGAHYYYRLRAIGSDGQVSDPVVTDAITATFTKTTTSDNTVLTFTSEDKLVSVTLPAGAVRAGTDCSVPADKLDVVNPKDQSLVVGPYTLLCKDNTGNTITSFVRPVNWVFDLNTNLAGRTSPKPVSVDESGRTGLIPGSTYTASTGLLEFGLTTSGATAVVATNTSGFGISANIVAVIGILIAIGVGGYIIANRIRQRQAYDRYLKSRYFNF